MYLQVSGAEMLLDDSVAVERRAREAGVEVRLDTFPGQQHTWHFSAGYAPEADDAIRRMADWVRRKL